MKALRFGGMVGLGCAVWAVCLVLGLAGSVRAQQVASIAVTFTLDGGDIKAGVDKKVTAAVISDTGELKALQGDFTWTVKDRGGYNTTTGTNPALTVKSAKPGVAREKSNVVNVYAEKAYTYIKLTGCYRESNIAQVCKDTLLWVGPGDPDRVWIEVSQDSINANLRIARRIDRIAIGGQETFVENFYGIVRDKFGNWVRRAATTTETGTALAGTSMLWTTNALSIATADVAPGNGNFTGPTATNISKASRGQGRASRVAERDGRTRLYAKYIMPGFSSIKQDTAEIVLNNVNYTDIRIVVKVGNNMPVPITSGKDQPVGTISTFVGVDTAIYAELYDPLNREWVGIPVTWTNVNNSVPGAAAPPGTASYWAITPIAPTTAAGGTITASTANGLTATAKIVAVNKDPAGTCIFTKRGTPDFSKSVSSYLLPAALPSTAQPYARPDQFVTVTAGAALPLVSKIFTDDIPSASSWLDESFSASAWVWSFVNGAPGTGTTLSSTTGDSVAFRSTVAHQRHRVRVVFTKSGKVPVQQDIIISVVPDIRTAAVTIENEWQMTTANANKPLRVPELAFAAGETEKRAYAVLRDQYGNYIAPSGAQIPSAYGIPPTVKKPDWTPPKLNNTGIVYAENGQVSQGQGNVITTGNAGAPLWVVVTDNTYNKKDSVKARLLNYYYENIQIVQKCATSNIGVSGYCSIPPTGINIITDDTTTLFVIGKCGDGNCDGGSAGGWELAPGDWGRNGVLTNALTVPPSGSNNWPLRPNSAGAGAVVVTKAGPGGATLTADVPVKITTGAPTRAELAILTPEDMRIAGQPIHFEVNYFNSLGEMREWNSSWANDGANFADLLAGLGFTNVSPNIVSDLKGRQDLYYKGNLGAGRVNAMLSHNLVTGRDIVTIWIYNATDNPHQIQYVETVGNKQLVAESERFTVLPAAPSKITIVGPDGRSIDSVKVNYNDPELIMRTVAEDPWGNRIGDYPSDWRADNPVIVNTQSRPIIVYVPGYAEENGCGWLVVTGSENKTLKDSLYICMTGVITRPLVAITRDYDGCGYLDRIEMRYRKPIYFKGGSTATVKNPNANLISVKYNTTTLTVDSVTVLPAKDSVIIWLRDVAPHGSAPLQTGWLPTVTIGKGFLYTGNGEDKDVCGNNAAFTENTTDGAPPVIEYAKLILPDNYVVVKFSEKVRPPSRSMFSPDAMVLNKEFPPELLFNILIKGQNKTLSPDMPPLSKTSAVDSDVSGAFSWRVDALGGIPGVYCNNEYILKFYLREGQRIGPPNDYINIRTPDQYYNPIDQPLVLDRAGNVPTTQNRKVKMLYGTAADAVASPDRVIPTARPADETAAVAPAAAPLTAEFTAGPNPAGKSSGGGAVSFFRHGARVAAATLSIYDASGNIVGKVHVVDDAPGGQSSRKVGSWDLRDAKGRLVPDGTYLARGAVKTKNGRTELVSLVLGVTR